MIKLYTLEEVAGMTGFALRTLYRDARAGKFEHVHRGRTRLMTDEQIEALVRQSVVAPGVEGHLQQADLDHIRRSLAGARSRR